MNQELTKEGIEFYAVRNYTNQACLSEEEFKHDLNRINLISRLLNKYCKDKSTFPIRLFLNHLITFYNVFEMRAATRMLDVSFNDDEAKMGVLKTCLLYLNYINDEYELTSYSVDLSIAKMLKDQI